MVLVLLVLRAVVLALTLLWTSPMPIDAAAAAAAAALRAMAAPKGGSWLTRKMTRWRSSRQSSTRCTTEASHDVSSVGPERASSKAYRLRPDEGDSE